MSFFIKLSFKVFFCLLFLTLWPSQAMAYIGPAIGYLAYLFGPLFALLALVAMALFYPIKMLLKRRRGSEKDDDLKTGKVSGKKKIRVVITTASMTYLVIFLSALLWPSMFNYLIIKPMNTLKSYIIIAKLKKNVHPSVYWSSAINKDKGVTLFNEDRVYEGLTVFSSSKEQKAFLIDMYGRIVYEWGLSFSDIWNNPTHVALKVPEHLQLWTRTSLFPNGDLLVIFTGVGSTPLGYGMAKINKDSKLLWRYSAPVHHDVEIDQNGRIYTLTHEKRDEPHPSIPQLKPPFFEDFLVILDKDGKELKKISFYDAFVGSDAEGLLHQLSLDPTDGLTPFGDTLHPNGIEIISQEVAGKQPMLIEGQILISFRNMSLLAILDPVTEKITWASYGAWRYQHDPRFLSNGTVVLFDNEGHLGIGGASRAINVDLQTGEILWSYTGSEQQPLYSAYHGSVDPLPNSNLLITESLGGRLLEVSKEGEIIWEYRIPWSEMEGDIEMIPAVYRGRRYKTEDLPFLNELSE